MHHIFCRPLAAAAAALLLSACGPKSEPPPNALNASAEATAAIGTNPAEAAAVIGAQPAEPVAVIDGRAISRDDFREFMSWRATQRGGEGKPQEALADLIDLHILAREAERRKFGERDDVKRRLALARANVLATALLGDMESSYGLTEKQIRREYERQVKAEAGTEPVPYPLARRQISQTLVRGHIHEQMEKLRKGVNIEQFSLSFFYEENED